jgi:UDP-glucose:(heptosyl)LPS alpha-1,3-glucosyltransferase
MKNQKHIVILKSRAQNNGGLEKYASRIASAFAEKGARISILTTGHTPASSNPLISFYPFTTNRWPSFIRMEQFDRSVSRWIASQKPDLVFGMDRNRFQTHIRAGNGVHISYLKSRIQTEGKFKHWMCLMNPMHRKILELEKTAFENPNLKKIIANSHMVRRELLEYYKIDPKKIEVIHNGVEWQEMETPFSMHVEAKIAAAKRFHLDPNCFHFLFIGNGFLRKGLGVLLEALSQIKNEQFHLSVVGKDNKTETFQAKAIQLGLKNKVRFFGPVDDITPFYQLSDVLVIPSFYDPFANVTIEALAMGLYIVSSKQNGGHEILTPTNGTVIENLLEIDSLSETLRACLNRPKTTLSANQIRRTVAHLDFSSQLKELMKACE